MLKVIENRILVEPIAEQQTSKKGIILETVKEKPMTGIVIAIGPGRSMENGSRENMDVKPGDMVFFTKYAPDEFVYDDHTYYSIQQSSILAIAPIKTLKEAAMENNDRELKANVEIQDRK